MVKDEVKSATGKVVNFGAIAAGLACGSRWTNTEYEMFHVSSLVQELKTQDCTERSKQVLFELEAQVGLT